MVDQIAAANSWLNGFVWGWPMIVLLLGTGILLTVLTGAAQFRYLGFAMREVLGKITQKSTEPGSVSPFQAVDTALASTVGVGNIAGVATAISIGGPGSLLWLWVSGLLGMCTVRRDRHRHAPSRARRDRGDAWRRHVHAEERPRPALARHRLRRPGVPGGVRHRQHGPGQLGRRQPAGVVRPRPHRHRHRPGRSLRGGDSRRHQPHWRGHRDPVPFMALFYLGGGIIILIRFASEVPGAIALVFESAFSAWRPPAGSPARR